MSSPKKEFGQEKAEAAIRIMEMYCVDNDDMNTWFMKKEIICFLMETWF